MVAWFNFLGDIGRWGQDVGRTMWRPADPADWVQERLKLVSWKLPCWRDRAQQLQEMAVSENSGTPKSSILIRCSIIKHPFWGTTIFGNTQILIRVVFIFNDYVLWDIDVQKRGYTIWIRVLVFVYEFVSQDGRMMENSAKQEKTENLIYIRLEHPAFGHIPAFQME